MNPHDWIVDRVIRHRKGKDGRTEFLPKWEGDQGESWEPLENFLTINSDWFQYCKDKGFKFNLVSTLARQD
mgnify:CR=1 FL=1